MIQRVYSKLSRNINAACMIIIGIFDSRTQMQVVLHRVINYIHAGLFCSKLDMVKVHRKTRLSQHFDNFGTCRGIKYLHKTGICFCCIILGLSSSGITFSPLLLNWASSYTVFCITITVIYIFKQHDPQSQFFSLKLVKPHKPLQQANIVLIPKALQICHIQYTQALEGCTGYTPRKKTIRSRSPS